MKQITYSELIKQRDNYTCQECGSKEELETHHKIPLVLGGKHHFDNIITLCKKCHWEAQYGDNDIARRFKAEISRRTKEGLKGKNPGRPKKDYNIYCKNCDKRGCKVRIKADEQFCKDHKCQEMGSFKEDKKDDKN